MNKAPPTEDDITSVIMTKAAQMAYEAWRNWQGIMAGSQTPLGRPWSEAPKGIQMNAIQLVLTCAADAEFGAEQAHAGWCAHMEAQGWKPGDTYDAGARIHPNLVPFTDLRPASKAEQELMVQIVRSILRHMIPDGALERYVEKLHNGQDSFIGRTLQ